MKIKSIAKTLLAGILAIKTAIVSLASHLLIILFLTIFFVIMAIDRKAGEIIADFLASPKKE